MTRPLVARAVVMTPAFKRGHRENQKTLRLPATSEKSARRTNASRYRRAPRRFDLAVPAAPPRRVTGCTPRLPRARSDRPFPSRRGRCFRAARPQPVARLARASPRKRRSAGFSGRKAPRRLSVPPGRTPSTAPAPREAPRRPRWTPPTARACCPWRTARTTPGPGTWSPTQRRSAARRTARPAR